MKQVIVSCDICMEQVKDESNLFTIRYFIPAANNQDTTLAHRKLECCEFCAHVAGKLIDDNIKHLIQNLKK